MERETQKRNVSEFNADAKENGGYRYTTNAPYSSVVANARMTDATVAAIPEGTSTVIDIGCGDGTYTHDLKSRLPGIAFTGFDPAAEAIGIAKRKFPGIEYVMGDLLDASTFPDRKFDVGVIRGVIHHLPDAALGIRNSARLADRIVLIEPNGNNPILKWLERNSRYHIEHEEQSFDDRQLSAWCREAGLAVIRLDYIGFIPMFFPALPARLIHFLQPLLERIGPLKKYLGAQIVIVCGKPAG
ncbi:MAG: Methyltransferase type 12 [Fibrobacteres bacterium]|nr:Methyltransferase type 12 [Fibrobacterota bacterium]